MPRTRASGWSVTVTHPQTNRTIRPEIAAEPDFRPSLNSLPEIRVPIPKDATWLDGQFDDDPAMSVHLDGRELPIDTLVDVQDSPGATVLVGRGGDELTDRVTAEYRTERRHTAAEELVSDNTSYATDVDAPDSTVQTDNVFQNPDTATELDDLVPDDIHAPWVFDSSEVKLAQTGFTQDTADLSIANQAVRITGDTSEDWEKDDYIEATGNDDGATFSFTPDYRIPSDNVVLHARYMGDADNGWTARVDGDIVARTAGDSVGTLDWITLNFDTVGSEAGYDGSHLTEGDSVVVEFRLDGDAGANNSIDIDCMALVDDRYNYNFDNTTDSNNNLAGPELFPPSITVEPDRSTAAFQIIKSTANLTIDDTSNNQFLQVSNDNKETWKPDDGTEENTDSVTVDFADIGASLRLRFALSRYSENGTRDDTPSEGYSTQAVDAWELLADERLESSIIDEKFDASLAEILTENAGPQFAWSYRIDDGTPTVAWTQYGQRTADDDPDLADATIEKKVETWDEVVINGSNVGIADESFTASSSFVDLNESRILPGSETVYSGGTYYDRGVDYEMNYSDGEIRAAAGDSNLTIGNSYTIDYRFQVQGTHTASTPVSRTFTETVTGVTSARQAEQIGFVLAEVDPAIQTPRFEGDITVPRVDATFDPLEALQLADLDLPAAARPLAPRGEPAITPGGITFRVGSSSRLEAQLSGIREQVQAVIRRS